MVFCSITSSTLVVMSNSAVISNSSVSSFAIEIWSAVREWIGSPIARMRLGEILDAMNVRHIAGLEMDLRDALIVAPDEAVKDLGEEPPLLAAEPAHDAEIDRDDAARVVDEEIALMHVGVKEAVAQARGAGRSGSAPARARADRSPSGVRRSGSASGMPSIHSIVMTSRVVRSQSIAGARISGSSFEFSANSEAAAASRRKSISIRTERASVSTTWTRRRRRISGAHRSASRAAKNMSARSRAKRRSTPARSTFTATGFAPSVRPDGGAVNLGDRGGGDRLAETLEQRVDLRAERRLDDADRGLTAHRRHPVLQALEFERDFRSDDVGPRRKKLAHLDVGRAEPVDGAREPGQAVDVALGDQIGERERQARDRRQQNRVDVDERPFPRKDKAGAREPEAMAERGDDRHESELPARMDGDDSAAQAA